MTDKPKKEQTVDGYMFYCQLCGKSVTSTERHTYEDCKVFMMKSGRLPLTKTRMKIKDFILADAQLRNRIKYEATTQEQIDALEVWDNSYGFTMTEKEIDRNQRSERNEYVMKVFNLLSSTEGKNRNQIAKECKLSWDAVDNALQLLISLKIAYLDNKLYFLLYERLSDLFYQIKAMNEILKKKDEQINLLEERLLRIRFTKGWLRDAE